MLDASFENISTNSLKGPGKTSFGSGSFTTARRRYLRISSAIIAKTSTPYAYISSIVPTLNTSAISTTLTFFSFYVEASNRLELVRRLGATAFF